MQTLAGIDTTQVYHEFGFDFDQVKDLKLKQYFVHKDVVNWFEELLVNKFRVFPFIKIIYERLHHFNINHLKCVDIYYGENDFEMFQHFKSEMDEIILIAQYKMPWISDTIYYLRNKPLSTNGTFNDDLNHLDILYKDQLKLFDGLLRNNNIQNYLTKQYKMEVDWDKKYSLTVYELKPNLSEAQSLFINIIFRDKFKQPIIISEDLMFLKCTEPPIVMKSFVLTVFHNLLSRLTIEDILSLELANKDYRYEWYNSVLDRDIQSHLKQRFSLFQKQKKIKATIAAKFTNQRLRKYFLYKYRDGIPATGQLTLSRNDSDFTMTGRKSAIRFDIISPEKITVYSITVLRHNSGNLIKTNCMITREIRLDSDISSILNEITNPPYFFEITFRSKIKSDNLTDILHTVLKQFRFDHNSIIQLRSYKNRINNCILSSFMKRAYKFEIRIKNMIFDTKSLVHWLCNCSRLSNISFTDCIFRLTDESFRTLKIMIKQREIIGRCRSNLTFRNMIFDVSTFSTFLHISSGNIIYDSCYLTPSSSVIIPPTYVKTTVCKNMNIDFQVLVPFLPYILFKLDNCHIQSNNDPILHVNSMVESSRCSLPIFINLDIYAEVLLNLSVYIRDMYLDHCRILSNETVDIPFNYPTNLLIYMKNVEIEWKAAAKIFNIFQRVNFIGSRFLCTDLSTPEISVNSNSILTFYRISITPEFLKGLQYLNICDRICFNNCQITNRNLLDIWAAAPRCKHISITKPHLVDYNFYFELIYKIYENQLDAILHELKDGVAIPLLDLLEIEWPSSDINIDWQNIKIKSVFENNTIVKLEYLRNGEVMDLPYERYFLPSDSDICEVDYY